MILNLPYDIKWNIAHYIDDIDTRRKFNIYGKIDLNKYQIIQRTIRKDLRIRSNYWLQSNFYANYENVKKRYYNVNRLVFPGDDLLDVFIKMTHDKVYYQLGIYKLRKRPFKGYINKNDVFYKGELHNNYYWQFISISYKI